jgi:hypothetical protein
VGLGYSKAGLYSGLSGIAGMQTGQFIEWRNFLIHKNAQKAYFRRRINAIINVISAGHCTQ